MTQTTTTVSVGMPTRIQKSMDRGDAVPQCRRPLLFPLTCQYRRNIAKGRSLWIEEATRLHDADDHYRFRRTPSENVEVYGLGRRDSTMQTTTTVSADVSAQTQHITKGRSLWIEEATRLHDADDHYCFRRSTSKNAEVYGSGKRRGSTNHYATLKGGGSHSLPNMMTLLIAASYLLLDVLLLDALLM